jgi:hypothetical protein
MRQVLLNTVFGVCFLIASISLYVGVAAQLFVPKLTHADRLVPPFAILLAFLLDMAVTLGLSRSGKRRLIWNLLLVSAAVILGAILTSVAVMRGSWWEMVKETLRVY